MIRSPKYHYMISNNNIKTNKGNVSLRRSWNHENDTNDKGSLK